MSDIALYRKYRPSSFDMVIGQEPVTTTLSNQVKGGLTKQAYLFVGQRGTGKTTTARVLAKSLCCTGNVKPCNACQSCLMTDNGTNDDIRELDAASNNSVEDIRTIIDDCKYKPRNGNKRVYIIDEVHMLSTSAFNALLKVLEEPPEHVAFILATTEFSKIPETITSRCQVFIFKPIKNDNIENTLKDICFKEQLEYDDSAIAMITELAHGSMRDAITMLDQCSSFGNITEESVTDIFGLVNESVIQDITEKIFDGDIRKAIDIITVVREQGKELSVIADMLFHHFLEMYISSQDNSMIRYMQIFGELSTRLKRDKRQNMVAFETAIVKACVQEMDNAEQPKVQQAETTDLDKRLQVIEKILHLGVYSNPHYIPPDFMNLPETCEDIPEPNIDIDMSKFIVIQYGCTVPIPEIQL